MEKGKQELPKIEISIKTILIGVGILIFLKFAWDIRDILLSLFIAIVVMSAAKQPVEALSKKGLNRGVAVFLVFLSFFATI